MSFIKRLNVVDRLQIILDKWNIPQRYPLSSWAGIEDFHLRIALATDLPLAIESNPSYSYPSSNGNSGITWRLVLIGPKPLIINCYATFYDDLWTLTSALSQPLSINHTKLLPLNNQDPWLKSMTLTLALASALDVESGEAKASGEARLELYPQILEVVKQEEIKVNAALVKADIKKGMPKNSTLIINDWLTPKDKIGLYRKANDFRSCALIVINSKALGNRDYLRQVIKHELIHAALTREGYQHGHDKLFQKLAELSGLEEQYRK